MKRLSFIFDTFPRRLIFITATNILLFTALNIIIAMLPTVYAKIIDTALNHSFQSSLLLWWALVNLIAVIGKQVCTYLNGNHTVKLYENLCVRLSKHLFASFYPQIEEKGTGYYSNLYTSTGKKLLNCSRSTICNPLYKSSK